jgi:hypothetical protein
MIRRLKTWIYSLVRIYRYATGKAKVYHTGKNKSSLKIAAELFSWLITEGYFNFIYYAYGLNISGTKQSDYIGRKKILYFKKNAEYQLKKRANCQMFDYDVITKDKFYANAVMTANNISCVKDEAIISNSQVIFKDGNCKDLDALLDFNGQIFIKNTVLEASDGVIVCQVKNRQLYLKDQLITLEELSKILKAGKWVVQRSQKSHPEIRKVNASALNTTRIVTILNGNEPVYLTGFQSFAVKNEKTDAWGKGSIYVGIDIAKSCLKKDGYYQPDIGKEGIVNKHPDSGIVFDGYVISELQNAVNLCLKAHKFLYFNFIIGWDVAITENGPLILEVNEKPGMNAVQCFSGGLNKSITDYYSKCMKEQS